MTSRALRNAASPLGAETYVVLDLTGPGANEVRRIRKQHGYDFYGALPVEVTVAGSGGLGTIAPDQRPVDVYSALDDIARQTSPITARFGPVLRFPGTSIFVLTPENPEPFVELHERIGRSGIRFEPSPFPFTAHCTLRGAIGGDVDEEEALALLATSVRDEIRCEMLSVYSVEAFPVLTLRHRSHLGGGV